MLVALEKAQFTEQQLVLMIDTNDELKKQLEIVRETIRLLEDQIVAYKELVETAKLVQDAKDKACQEQIKAVTPTFSDNLQKYMTGAGVGAVMMGLIWMLTLI